MSSLPDFLVAIDAARVKGEAKARLYVQGVCQTLANEVSSGGKYSPGTPIDTGFARASWDAGIGGAPSSTAADSPEARAQRMSGAIQEMGSGDSGGSGYHFGYSSRRLRRLRLRRRLRRLRQVGDTLEAGAQRMSGAIQEMQVGDTLVLVNTAPYIRRLEYGFVGQDSLGRTYNQPGRGFIGLAVNAIDQIEAEVAAHLETLP